MQRETTDKLHRGPEAPSSAKGFDLSGEGPHGLS